MDWKNDLEIAIPNLYVIVPNIYVTWTVHVDTSTSILKLDITSGARKHWLPQQNFILFHFDDETDAFLVTIFCFFLKKFITETSEVQWK